MSVDNTAWVDTFSPLTGGAFAVHRALADSANAEHGDELWMAQAKLARKARVTRATVQRALAAMLNEPDPAGRRENPWPPLLELLEAGKGKGSPNRYRLLRPSLPVIYDAKAKGGVPHHEAPGCLTTMHEVPHHDAPGASPRGTGVPHHEAQSQVGTQEEPKQEPLPVEPAPADPAVLIAREVWEACKAAGRPKPATPYVAVVRIGKRLLAAGHEPATIVAAMLDAPTISTGAVEFAIARRKPSPITRLREDRGGPEGTVEL